MQKDIFLAPCRGDEPESPGLVKFNYSTNCHHNHLIQVGTQRAESLRPSLLLSFRPRQSSVANI